ncbi:YgjP-like metallopeptidase domain-containing protein, partial [Tabrizicola caldifontis]|uniref:YgjP-like metallopeptidase domain-containing protein n=1 Tax=Tabrizicola caldifontis TaxID=2528036 RepID=UPI00197E3B39
FKSPMWITPLPPPLTALGEGSHGSILSGNYTPTRLSSGWKSTPAGSTTDQKAHWMATWYRSQLREKAAPRIAKWSDRLGVLMPRWGIRLMKTKWGSCNTEKGLVWLNLDLAKKPLAALDYVILHEMAHFVSPRHDDLFLSTLNRHMPGWRQIRTDLNALPLSE